MKTRLVKIGSSRGIRLPKPLIEEAGLVDDVELRVRAGAITILPSKAPRVGWADAARSLREHGDSGMLDDTTPTRFDEDEWQW